MNIIHFFAKYVKPKRFKGTGMLNPAPTGRINEKLYVIKEGDVNFYLYKVKNGYIAIDSGYEKFKGVEEKIASLYIDKDLVKWVFLTHADVDHAGGIVDGGNIFKNAKVYIHKEEETMLLGKEYRFKFLFIKIKNPVKRLSGYEVLCDGKIINAGESKVEIFHLPGHTLGHSAFLIDDKILFTGDSIALNCGVGYCFFDFFNMDTSLNIKSLKKFKEIMKNKNIEIICTGHSGVINDSSHLFDKIDNVAYGSKKNPFDKSAPLDVFSED